MTRSKTSRDLLIVEDDPDLRDMLQDYFTLAGYGVTTTGLAEGFRSLLGRQTFDLILLDLNLPDGDGLKLLQELRRWSSVLILVVTGRRDPESRLTALELEADDFINKPFILRELELRVRNCLKRHHQVPEEQLWSLAGWHFDPRQQRLRQSGKGDVSASHQMIILTAGESLCLRALLRTSGALVSSQQLVAAMRSPLGQAEAESLPVIISRLRQKLRLTMPDATSNPIENVPRQGYRINLSLWPTLSQ